MKEDGITNINNNHIKKFFFLVFTSRDNGEHFLVSTMILQLVDVPYVSYRWSRTGL